MIKFNYAARQLEKSCKLCFSTFEKQLAKFKTKFENVLAMIYKHPTQTHAWTQTKHQKFKINKCTLMITQFKQ